MGQKIRRSVKVEELGPPQVIPFLTVKDVDGEIAFLQKVFECGDPTGTVHDQEGHLQHAEVSIGDSRVLFARQMQPSEKLSEATLYVYVPDLEVTWDRAMRAGAKSVHRPSDQFYGDRAGGFKDPSGNTWWVARVIEKLSDDDLQSRYDKIYGPQAEWATKRVTTGQVPPSKSNGKDKAAAAGNGETATDRPKAQASKERPKAEPEAGSASKKASDAPEDTSGKQTETPSKVPLP